MGTHLLHALLNRDRISQHLEVKAVEMPAQVLFTDATTCRLVSPRGWINPGQPRAARP